MKTRKMASWLAIGLIVLLTLGAGGGMVNPQAAQAADDNSVPSITVLGTAERQAVPTIAYLDLGVVTEGDTLLEVQAANSVEMEQVLAKLKEEGIEEKDIQSSSYYVASQYDIETYTTVVGYQVSNSVRVTVRDIDQTGRILDAAVAAGSNRASGVSFDLTNEERDALYQEALKDAVRQGAGKAQALAEAVGARIDKPTHLIEGSHGTGPIPMPIMMDGRGGFKDAETPVVPGELTISASVTLVYHMK